MRWVAPKVGDERIITKFLIFPMELNGVTYWLERVSYVEVYEHFFEYDYFDSDNWIPTRWVKNDN